MVAERTMLAVLVFSQLYFECSSWGSDWGWGSGSNQNKDTLVLFGSGYEDDGISIPDDLVGLHQYSTGKIWPQYLAQKMNMRLKNYAVAGCTTGIDNIFFPGDTWSGNKWQANEYLKTTPRIPPNVLIGVATCAINEMFSNDFSEAHMNQMVSNIVSVLEQLSDAGATVIFVCNLPDYTLLPGAIGATREELQRNKSAVINHNNKMAAALMSVALKKSKTKFIPVPFDKYWASSIQSKPFQNFAAFTCDGIAAPDNVFNQLKLKPADVLKFSSYDGAHPATGVHFDIANNILGDLQNAGIKPCSGREWH